MHTLPNLPYSYDALEPYLDAETMEIHHGKHHQAYVDNLNKTLESYSDLTEKPLEVLLKNLDTVPNNIRTAVRNFGGGHWNHAFFWTILAKNNDAEPSGELKNAIEHAFGNFGTFKERFSKTATTFFGSGWTWLAANANGALEIASTANQDSPISEGKTPLCCIDLWEHAYYLKYRNRRADYVQAFWNVVNWDKVAKYFSVLSPKV